MKTTFLLPVFFLFPFFAIAQNADSTVIKQVDSLIQVSRTLTDKRDFNRALEVNAEAEKIALEKLGRESSAYGNCCSNHGRVMSLKGDKPEAEKWYFESKAIREKVLGKEHPDYAASLISLANMYSNMGKYEKAEPLYLEAKPIQEKALGKEHPDYAKSLFNLAGMYGTMGQYEKAEPLYLEALAIREKALDKEHPDYIASLFYLGQLYQNMGRYNKAEPLYLEALAIREKALGKAHPEYARSLHSLAYLYRQMGQIEKAEPLYFEAKSIREKALGKEHPDYAQSLNGLAILYSVMGRYEKAEPLYLEAKSIREKVLGKEHPHYANSLENLVFLYAKMCQYEKAESFCLEAKAIYENALGKDHPSYGTCLHNMANLYLEMCQYEKAEPLYLEAKSIREKALGKEHPEYAQSLTGLASLSKFMGNYEKAEQINFEALSITEKALGKEHPEYTRGLGNLANLYMARSQYEKAESNYLEAKLIQENTLGKEHPDYARSLNNLGVLYLQLGQYEKAKPLFLEVKDSWEKAFGKEHLDYAWCLDNLAILSYRMGQYEKAEPLYLESKAINEKALGKEHPDYAASLNNLATLYRDMGQNEKAQRSYLELSAVNNLLLEKAVRHLSERELNNYLITFSQSQDQILSFTQSTADSKLIPACYDNSLFYKGFLLKSAGRIKQLALSDTAAAEKFTLLKSYQRRLAALYAKPIAERDSIIIAELETQSNELEKDLTRTVAGFGEALRQVKWQEVQQNLKANEAALEFVHYRYHEKNQTDSTMYAALLLLPTEASAKAGKSQPQFIPLFEEKSLDSLLQRNGERSEHFVKQLYSLSDRGIIVAGKPLKSLYELLWQPLEKELTGTKTIYFSPSGLLHHLNLAAIPIGIDSVLGDRYQLVELGSTRSLAVATKAGQLVVPNQVKSSTNDAVLFGGIQYDSDITALTKAIASIDSVSIASRGELNFFYSDSTLRVGTWGSLPFTDREVGNLERILKAAGMPTQTRRAYTATEESFKSIGANGNPSPRILHIATHGFFFPDPQTSDGFKTLPTLSEPVFKISEHPMIRSGLLLAGANHAWKTGKPLKPGMEDGILTAYEISQMNLSNTELVVLSACETGLGDIQGNEGVYGLQRAFKIAGAKYLIMSLWQVPDKQTSLLMTTFYKKWLEQKMSIPEAFRAAQKELRDAGLDPYQWAGFVLVE